jgi:hypothetical protein
MKKGINVGELKKQLAKFEDDKFLFTEDTEEGLMVGVQGVYEINAPNEHSETSQFNGHIYLSTVE